MLSEVRCLTLLWELPIIYLYTLELVLPGYFLGSETRFHIQVCVIIQA